jgi:hypothetical protein
MPISQACESLFVGARLAGEGALKNAFAGKSDRRTASSYKPGFSLTDGHWDRGCILNEGHQLSMCRG